MTQPVRIGMIGTGFMSRTHSACLQLDPRAHLARVASRTEEGARAFAREYGYAAWSGDWRDVVEDPDIDVVDITAPNALHAEIAIAAAEAGKHVIVEKPVATTLEDAERVVDAVHSARVLGLYAENRRFAPVLLETKQLLERGKIGRPHLIRINELGSGPTHAEWFRQPDVAGGGALIDLGVHGIYVLEWLMNEPIVEVSATARYPDGPPLDETMCVSYRFSSGAVGQTVSSWAARGGIDLRTELFGDAGTLMLDQSRTISGIHLYRDEAETADDGTPHLAAQSGWSYPQVDALRTRGSLGAMRHFVDCLAEGITPQCTLEQGMRVMELVDAIYRSAQERCAVAVPAQSALVTTEVS